MPETYDLSQNYPNPFHLHTTIRFAIPQAGHVRLQVYDVLGHLVETLVEGARPAGHYAAAWEAAQTSSGAYFYRLQTNGHAEIMKMILMR